MYIRKHYLYDFLIIGFFVIWALIDIFSFLVDYSAFIDIGYLLLFVVLFQFSIKQTVHKTNRLRSVTNSIYVLASLVIVSALVGYINKNSFEFNALIIVNIGVSSQSLFYLFHCRYEIV